MTLNKIVKLASHKYNFKNIESYISFCKIFLEYISNDNLQAIIVSQNENQYCFYQYDKFGKYQISRPINSNLMYDFNSFESIGNVMLQMELDKLNH